MLQDCFYLFLDINVVDCKDQSSGCCPAILPYCVLINICCLTTIMWSPVLILTLSPLPSHLSQVCMESLHSVRMSSHVCFITFHLLTKHNSIELECQACCCNTELVPSLIPNYSIADIKLRTERHVARSGHVSSTPLTSLIFSILLFAFAS